MRRLAIIPNDPIDLYLSTGYTERWLKDYFNPCGFFDEVYSRLGYQLVGTTAVLPPPLNPFGGGSRPPWAR